MNKGNKYCSLNIENCFNHKLFYTDTVEAEKEIEPGLEGLYINIKENNISSHLQSPKGIPFKLNLGKKDNFYCDGQILKIGLQTDEIHFLGFCYFGDMNIKVVLRMKSGGEQIIDVHMRECSIDSNCDGWYTIFTPAHDKLESVARFITAGRAKQPFYIFDRTCILPQAYEVEELFIPKNIFFHILAVTIKV